MVGTGSVALIIAASTPSQALATGQDTTCGNPSTNWAQEMCLSLYPNANGSTDNYMTNGWTGSVYDNPRLCYLGDKKYQNGTTVAGNVYSARNKDNVRQEELCLQNDLNDNIYVITYSYVGWKNTSTYHYAISWMTATSDCG